MKKMIKIGVSLRLIQISQIIVTVIMSGIVIFSTFLLINTFSRLSRSNQEHMELVKAAHELMDASDYLTERVQRFTLNGDRGFMDDYFTEAFESNRREDAIERMRMNDKRTHAALEQLLGAMKNSVILMDTEYYAMRLVVEAKGYTDYPEILDSVELSASDAALSSEDKMRRATDLVLNNDYYLQKDRIRTDMRESLNEIDKMIEGTEDMENEALEKELNLVRVVVILQIVSVMVMVVLTSTMGINPVVRAVDQIRDDRPLTESGAVEFRYLAQAYNKMFSSYRNSLDRLKYKASHDELTGAYNRAGYDLLLSNIDLNSTYVILFDMDNFKSINDNYGHETGDKALIRLVRILEGVFRDDDCICRIGGDEFVVFMVHVGDRQRLLVSAKIEQINRELDQPEDDIPPMSVSVGIIHGTQAGSVDGLFEKLDDAMYASKNQGKHAYTFYNELGKKG